MKIALLGPTLTSACRNALGVSLAGAPAGTAQTPLAPLAAGLRTMGHDIHIITTDASVSTPVKIEEDNFSITYCPLRGAPTYRARVRSMDLFEREIRFMEVALRESAPDVVHAHWTYEFAEAAVRSRLPHVVTMHDLGWDYLRIFRDPYRAMRLLMKYRVMPRIQNLTVVAPFMAKKAWQYGYFGRVDVVPNGLTVPKPISVTAPRAPEWGPKLFTIGNPGPIKNVQASVNAFRIVRRFFPNAELHLYGPGLNEGYVNGEVGVLGHGNVDHGVLMDHLAREATLLIHPSRLECCPMIVAEAKVRGVPVIGGKNSGGVAYVCGSSGAVTTDIESPEAIADAVIALLASPTKLEEERRRARADAEERFDTHNVTQMYTDVYERVLGRKLGRPVR